LATFPAFGIKVASNPKASLAALECVDGLAFLSTLYTRPEHRGQGLGSAVEKRVCQGIIDELGIWPIKLVTGRRPRVGKMSELSPVWTRLKNVDSGGYLDFYYTYFYKQFREPVLVYEN